MIRNLQDVASLAGNERQRLAAGMLAIRATGQSVAASTRTAHYESILGHQLGRLQALSSQLRRVYRSYASASVTAQFELCPEPDFACTNAADAAWAHASGAGIEASGESARLESVSSGALELMKGVSVEVPLLYRSDSIGKDVCVADGDLAMANRGYSSASWVNSGTGVRLCIGAEYQSDHSNRARDLRASHRAPLAISPSLIEGAKGGRKGRQGDATRPPNGGAPSPAGPSVSLQYSSEEVYARADQAVAVAVESEQADNDAARIEQSTSDVAELMRIFSEQVHMQDEVIQQIEVDTEEASDAVKEGVGYLHEAAEAPMSFTMCVSMLLVVLALFLLLVHIITP